MQEKLKKNDNSEAENSRRRLEKELVAEVEKDFYARRAERLTLERQWELNLNFLMGNQYCDIDGRGDVCDTEKDFFWQSRGVFNHIAPIMETRLAKLSRVTPEVSVRPASDDDSDVEKALLAEKLIAEAFKNAKADKMVGKATEWSEMCGTSFYKVVWDNDGGGEVGILDGRKLYEGDVKIIPVSPFEIFPDSIFADGIEGCNSIIHARALSVKVVKAKYGVDMPGSDIDVFGLTAPSGRVKAAPHTVHDSVTVIERYEKPCAEYKEGRLITVAGGKLLYCGPLPYKNGKDGEAVFPFIRQVSVSVPGCFFGRSIVERLIPVQRAFNAVKNRKHEFLNRLSMGVMTVEDGSVDTEDLATDGLSPGKVLVYRQGSKAPEMMEETSLPPAFNEEEEKLINEFVIISGVSDVSSSSENAKISSGSALEILIGQDNERLTVNAERIRSSYLEIARQTLRLYAQFMTGVKLIKGKDAFDKTKIYYADKNTATSDDVYLESENELLYTHSQKKDMIFKLYESGLLTGEDGNLRSTTKEKLLSLLGYKDLDYRKGLSRLHEEKAQEENELIRKKGVGVDVVDDDVIHVDEHTRYVLSEYPELSDEEKNRLFAHISEHNARILNKEQKKYGK